MRAYETATIWSTSLSESELEKELSKILEIIEAEKGSPGRTDTWGRRQLAYPIRKQTEGIYVFFNWDGDEKVTAGIDKHLRINDVCLRYLTLRRDRDEDVPVPAEPPAAAPAEEPAAAVEPPAEEPAPEETAAPVEEPVTEEAPAPDETEAVSEETPEPDTTEAPETPQEEEEQSPPAEDEEKPVESGE